MRGMGQLGEYLVAEGPPQFASWHQLERNFRPGLIVMGSVPAPATEQPVGPTGTDRLFCFLRKRLKPRLWAQLHDFKAPWPIPT